MKIKIPNSIAIGATRADIVIADNLATDEGYNGTFNRRTQVLELDSRLFGEKLDKVFGHEVLEMIKENYCLDTSEDDMSRISHGIMEFLWQLGIELDYSDIPNRVE